jgi:antitoxin CptB
MREMDILMTRFLQRGYADLSSSDRQVFDRLLDCADQDILHWLSSDAQPDDPQLSTLIDVMRPIVSKP